MDFDRRTALRIAGLGAAATLAGCLGDGGGGDDDTPTPTGTPDDTGVADHETVPFALRSDVEWSEEEAVGQVIVADSEDRERAALASYEPPEDRAGDVEAFLERVDYETDRLVFVESVGPDGCHDRVEVDDVRLEEGRLRAAAAVRDRTEEYGGCTDALVYPSTLLRVRFEGDPVDEVAVDVTDGWDETATVTASADDPLPSPDPEDLQGYVRPDDDPEPVAPRECDEEGVHRHDQWYDESDVYWGDYEADGDPTMSLRVDGLEKQYGDTLTVRLTNVSGEERQTGNRHMYNFQVYTEDGWQDVRVRDQDSWPYTEEAVNHAPGGGFEWTFELTEAGIVADAFHDDARVCPDLESGRYRVAYFGLLGDGAVAASFDLTV